MKKLVLALTALAAFTGSASAADLGARPYTKAPAPVAMAPSWTGFYIFGGGGGGIWAANGGVDNDRDGHLHHLHQHPDGRQMAGSARSVPAMTGRLGPSWVVGIFGDGQFGSLKGNIGDATVPARRRDTRRWRQLGQPVLVLAISLLRTFCPTSTAVTPGPTGRAAPC